MLPGKVSLSTCVVPATVSEERCGASSTGWSWCGKCRKVRIYTRNSHGRKEDVVFSWIHPGKLTWNTVMEVWFRWFSFSKWAVSGSMLIFQGVPFWPSGGNIVRSLRKPVFVVLIVGGFFQTRDPPKCPGNDQQCFDAFIKWDSSDILLIYSDLLCPNISGT